MKHETRVAKSEKILKITQVQTRVVHLNQPVMSYRKVVYCRFFQFWLIFPNRI